MEEDGNNLTLLVASEIRTALISWTETKHKFSEALNELESPSDAISAAKSEETMFEIIQLIVWLFAK